MLVQRGDLGVGRVQRALYFHQRALIGRFLRQAFDLLGKRVLGGGDFLQAYFQCGDLIRRFLQLCQVCRRACLGSGAGSLLSGDLLVQLGQLGFLVGQLVLGLGQLGLRIGKGGFQLLHLGGGFAVVAQRFSVRGLGGGKIFIGHVQLILQAGDIQLQGGDAFFQRGYLGLQFALIADGQGQVVQQRVSVGLGLGKLIPQGGDIGVCSVQLGLQRIGSSLGGVQLGLQVGVLAGGFFAGFGQRFNIGFGGVQIGLQLRCNLGRIGKLGGQVVFILLEAAVQAQQPDDDGQGHDDNRR